MRLGPDSTGNDLNTVMFPWCGAEECLKMKLTERSQDHAKLGESGTAECPPAPEALLGINPNGINEDTWPALVERASGCDGDAYQDLYTRLADYRQCFPRQLFGDPECAYGEFVQELLDQIRYGILRDPQSLLAEARTRAVRKTADRIRSLTTAARLLSTLPRRHREVLIRAQLSLASRRDRNAPVRRGAEATAG